MPTTNLKNITIEQRQTTTLEEAFFIIRDNDTNQAYFCFQNHLKDSWDELVNNYQNIREVELVIYPAGERQ
jgi:hypothetical protein